MTTMRTISRKRQFLRWAGLVACVVLFLAMVASRWWYCGYRSHSWYAVVGLGAVGFEYGRPWGLDSVLPIGWHFGACTSPKILLLPRRLYSGHNLYRCSVPLWIPLLIIGVPMFLAWRRDCPYPPGHCAECGYDLTGNVSGTCSECGTEIAP